MAWATSPAAYTSLALVISLESTMMPRSTLIPASLAMALCGTTPMATTTTSVSRKRPSVKSTPLTRPFVSRWISLAVTPQLTSMPTFFRRLAASLPAFSSKPAERMRGASSTMVTATPRSCRLSAALSPMSPPPMTTARLILAESSISVWAWARVVKL